jgi:hypothetical protein
MVKINSKAKLCNVNDVFFSSSYYTYTLSFRKDRSRVDLLFVLKTNPMGHVEVIQDENNESNVGDDVFQVSELLDPYQVGPSIDSKENSIFCVAENIFVDNDVEELNIVLSSSGQAQVDEDDDNNEINIKDCDEGDNESIEEKEDNFD